MFVESVTRYRLPPTKNGREVLKGSYRSQRTHAIHLGFTFLERVLLRYPAVEVRSECGNDSKVCNWGGAVQGTSSLVHRQDAGVKREGSDLGSISFPKLKWLPEDTNGRVLINGSLLFST